MCIEEQKQFRGPQDENEEGLWKKKKYNLNKNSKAKGRSNIPNRQC